MAFRKPGTKIIGGKFLIYGLSHEGKSWFGLTFPEVAAIDSEVGLAFEEGKDIEIGGNTYNNLVLVDTTADLDDLEENLDAILDGDVACKTLLIDSETKFYNAMDIGATEVEERKAKQAGKSVDTRGKWGRVKNINTKLQQAKITLSAQGKFVVSTAQGKEITDDKTKEITGWKPQCHGSLPFDYDTVLRAYTEIDKKTKERRFFTEVEKDRTHVTKKGDIIENCTYDIWKDYFEGRTSTGTKSDADYRKDLKNATNGVLNEEEKLEGNLEEIREEFKGIFKLADANKRKEIQEACKIAGITESPLKCECLDKMKVLIAAVRKL